MKQYNSILILILVSTLTALSANVHAETTVILDLTQRIASQSAEYRQKQAQLIGLDRQKERAEKAYQKVRETKKGTKDYSYAVSNFVNTRLAVIEPKVTLINELKGLTLQSGEDLIALASAVAAQNQHHGFTGDPAQLELIGETFEGTDALVSIINNDPVLANDPSVRSLSQTFRGLRRELINFERGNSGNNHDQIQTMLAIADTQTALLSVAKNRLRNEIDQIKMIQVNTLTATITREVDSVLEDLYGTLSYDSAGSDQWNDRYQSIMDDTLYTSNSSSVGGWSTNPEDNLRERNQMRKALGLPEVTE